MKRVFWVLAILWSGIVSGLFFENFDDIRKVTAGMARREALSHFNKDQASRLWAASHGGVYVPVTEKLTPNPYLAHVPARDIIGPGGTVLTLMNPAYMMREMMNHYSELYGIRGHITSLRHFRSETAPDPWERSALLAFERGVGEVCETSEIEGEPYLRLMKPMFTQKDCLKCHGEQGYKEGDIRGGVSVSVPLSPLSGFSETRDPCARDLFLAFVGNRVRSHRFPREKNHALHGTTYRNGRKIHHRG